MRLVRLVRRGSGAGLNSSESTPRRTLQRFALGLPGTSGVVAVPVHFHAVPVRFHAASVHVRGWRGSIREGSSVLCRPGVAPTHCVGRSQGTDGSLFHDGLKLVEDGIVVQKGFRPLVDSFRLAPPPMRPPCVAHPLCPAPPCAWSQIVHGDVPGAQRMACAYRSRLSLPRHAINAAHAPFAPGALPAPAAPSATTTK